MPSPTSPTLPRLFSLSSAASPAKQRIFTNDSVPQVGNYLKSPTGFSTTSLHFSPGPSQHCHGTSFDFGLSFGTPQAGLAEVSSPVTADPNRFEVHSSHTNISSCFPIGSAVQSPTYLDNAIWPLASIEEARLMRYFVDHLGLWVGLPREVKSQADGLPPSLISVIPSDTSPLSFRKERLLVRLCSMPCS